MGLFGWCVATLLCCLILGGGTKDGFLSDFALQILSIPLLLVSLWQFSNIAMSRNMRWALAFCLLLAAVPLVQLIPLPPLLWTALPGRHAEAAALALVQRDLPWMPISVSPAVTWLSLLSLIPPVAIFLGTILLRYHQRRRLSLVLLGFGILSAFLGLVQIAQGPSSSLRLFDFTNDTEAVGFFANRNHFAALLYCLTLFAAAWAVSVSFGGDHRELRGPKIVAIVASFTVIVALISAQAMARSRAGLGLTMVALFGAFALAFVGQPRESTGPTLATKLLTTAITLALVFGAQFALYRILERFAIDPLADGRVAFARVTTEAAKSYIPFGAGEGTFVPVYAGFERPQDTFADTFANRAHNDFLEGLLESGIVGIALLAYFVGWFVMASSRVWRRALPGMTQIDQLLSLAATIVVALLLAHSFADYPLRTAAIMGVFAFACALLVEPIAETQDGVRTRSPRLSEFQWAEPKLAAQPAVASSAPAGTPKPRRKWGGDVAWPEEWQKPQDSRSGKPRA